jgi:hypothetical protein
MAQTRTTNEQMITNIIGDWTPTSHPELFKSGYNYVADLIPASSELWSSDNLRTLTFASESAVIQSGQSSTKIIKVIRTDASLDRECVEVSYKDYIRGKDTNSIFYNGKNINSPVWSWTPVGTITVNPPTTEGSNASITVYYWIYEYNDYFGTSAGGDSFDAMHITDDIFGFPREAHLLATIRSSQNILQTKIGAAVHTDEDSELLQLLQGQMVILDKWFQEEAQRLRLPYKVIGVEDK